MGPRLINRPKTYYASYSPTPVDTTGNVLDRK
mgnify:CR=1 FL=1